MVISGKAEGLTVLLLHHAQSQAVALEEIEGD